MKKLIPFAFEYAFMNYVPPSIDTQFMCIVDRKQPQLAAVIASYLLRKDSYFPFFEFPLVTAAFAEVLPGDVDEATLSRIQGKLAALFINNAISRAGKPEYLILAGLSADQKSYLHFPHDQTILDIPDIQSISFLLAPLFTYTRHPLRCHPSQLLEGLYLCGKYSMVLLPDDATDLLNVPADNAVGMVVIEKEGSASSVLAVNYAVSIGAHIHLVEHLPVFRHNEIHHTIQDWRNGDTASFDELMEMGDIRIGSIDFSSYQYATFFTQGFPYGLIIDNIIPCTHVNMELKPDLFIINNLLYYDRYSTGSAVVFSPGLFKDEETQPVANELHAHHFYTKILLGKAANVHQLDMHLREFPGDLFHLCTHAGEVPGRRFSLSFTDRNGVVHEVTYDEVLSITPDKDPEYMRVQEKTIFRSFDGHPWHGPELKGLQFPAFVFTDMMNALHASKFKDKKLLNDAITVVNSCGITCSDGVHQGMLTTLASHRSPIIFNNACWSWDEMAKNMLLSGARGYIGTLWNVANEEAVTVARHFYHHAFSMTIMEALHKAAEQIRTTSSEDIYLFWGLHFSRLHPPANIEQARRQTFRALMRNVAHWQHRIKENEQSTEAGKEHLNRPEIDRILDWTTKEIALFGEKDYAIYMKEGK